MAASDAVPVIIGAGIGAGGAVIAQIISSVFNAKRERRQLDWETKRQERAWEMQQEERFLKLKQELYATVALTANNFLAYIYYPIDYPNSDPPEPRPSLPDLKEMLRIRSNVEIIAPKEVSEPIRAAFIKFDDAKEASNSPHPSRERMKREAEEAVSKWMEAYRAIRADLHGVQDGSGGSEPDQDRTQ